MNIMLKEIQTQMGLGNYTEAGNLLDLAIQQNPCDYEAYFLRGKLNRQKGQIARAINDFAIAYELNPSSAEAEVALDMAKSIISFRNPDLYNP